MRLVSVDGRWYLEGWCQLAEGVRLFRLDRIVELRSLGGRRRPLPSEAVPRDLAEGLFRPRDDDLTVVLELEPAARWVADYYPVESGGRARTASGERRTGPPGGCGSSCARPTHPGSFVWRCGSAAGDAWSRRLPVSPREVRRRPQAALDALGG